METFDTYFEKGMQCYQNNNFKLAIFYLSKCLELDPSNYAVYNNRGLMYYNIDNYEMAIKDFNNSLLLNPNNFETIFNRGLANQQLGIYDKALIDFNVVKVNSYEFKDIEAEIQKTLDLKNGKAISLNFISNFTHDGGDPQVAFNSGKFFYEKEYYQKAIEDFTNAINYKQDFVEAYFQRSKCFTILKKFDKAIDDINIASKYTNANDEINGRIGFIYFKMGKLEIALEYFNSAIEYNPKNSSHFYHRGLVKSQLKHYKDAIYDFTKCLDISPNHIESRYQRSNAYYNDENYPVAKIEALELLKFFPQNGNLNYIVGVIEYNFGIKSESYKYFKQAKTNGYKDAEDFIDQYFST